METKENIFKYAGYSAYIATRALNIDDVGALTSSRCRWLIREFNNNWDSMPKSMTRLFGSLNMRLKVKVEDFSAVEWDEKAVRREYEELAENRNLMNTLRRAIRDYAMDADAVAAAFDLNARQLDDLLRRGVWPSEDLLKAIRNSLPLDDGFPGRFQIFTSKEEI